MTMAYESDRKNSESSDPHYWDHLPLSARMLFTESCEDTEQDVAEKPIADAAKGLPVAVAR
jgi:hypothetical protein